MVYMAVKNHTKEEEDDDEDDSDEDDDDDISMFLNVTCFSPFSLTDCVVRSQSQLYCQFLDVMQTGKGVEKTFLSSLTYKVNTD